MKKLLILPLLLILATGCATPGETSNNNDKVYFYTDEETCVNYIIYQYSSYGGDITPRLNKDGTIMLNEECLNKKGE